MDYAKELKEAAERLAHRDNEIMRRLTRALVVNYNHLRQLELDYEDERNGDWTR